MRIFLFALGARGSCLLLPSTAGASTGAELWPWGYCPPAPAGSDPGWTLHRAVSGSTASARLAAKCSRAAVPPEEGRESPGQQTQQSTNPAAQMHRSAGCRSLRSCSESFHATMARLQVKRSSSLFCIKSWSLVPAVIADASALGASCRELLENPTSQKNKTLEQQKTATGMQEMRAENEMLSNPSENQGRQTGGG